MAKRDAGDEAYHSGTGHGASPKTGVRPSVGQSKPYTSGSNAHGRHEHGKAQPSGGPVMPMSEPSKKTY